MKDIINELKIAHIGYAIIYFTIVMFICLIVALDLMNHTNGDFSGFDYLTLIKYITIISGLMLLIVDLFNLSKSSTIEHPVYFVPLAIVLCVLIWAITIFSIMYLGIIVVLAINNIISI